MKKRRLKRNQAHTDQQQQSNPELLESQQRVKINRAKVGQAQSTTKTQRSTGSASRVKQLTKQCSAVHQNAMNVVWILLSEAGL